MTNFSTETTDVKTQKITAIITRNKKTLTARKDKMIAASKKTAMIDKMINIYSDRDFVKTCLTNNVEIDFLETNMKSIERVASIIKGLTSNKNMSHYVSDFLRCAISYQNKENKDSISNQHCLAIFQNTHTAQSRELVQDDRRQASNSAQTQISILRATLVALKSAIIIENPEDAKNSILKIDYSTDIMQAILKHFNFEYSVTSD